MYCYNKTLLNSLIQIPRCVAISNVLLILKTCYCNVSIIRAAFYSKEDTIISGLRTPIFINGGG